jgi:biofilm PGA synthesis N-glycosyltransferase PgaC
MNTDANSFKYVLITAVKNEEKYIEQTINSIISQTIKPIVWVIISDGSTDRTDEIISKYTSNNDFIKFLRYVNTSDNKQISYRKVSAINYGLSHLAGVEYDYIGCLDGDVTFNTTFYEQLIEKVQRNEKIGLAGGYIYNVFKTGLGSFCTSPTSVGGAIQFFRRKCFEDINGYLPVAFEDAIANVSSRMHGWKVQSFSDLIVYHHKPSGIAGRNIFKAKFNVGKVEHLTGDHPVFQFIRSLSHLTRRPVFIGAFLRIAGFWSSMIRREKIQTPQDIVKYLRKEQMNKLNVFLMIKKRISLK